MKELLEKFENKRPEVVFEWKDSETEAEGWVVINSLRGGAAGGGTRMRPGLDKHEVESLAKTMEVKFTVSGPEIGGAKSGINFDPSDPRKKGVLERWYKAVYPLLKNYYGTGGDLNVDEIHEVIPITEEYGLWHPQEGVVNGHYNATEPEKIKKLGQLRQGVIKVIEAPNYSPDIKRKYTVADMVTGFGVAKSVEHYYNIWGGKLHKKRAVIQGWGNVGASAAYFLAQAGVKIVGIIDRNGGLINQDGFTLEELTDLFINRNGNELISEDIIPFDEINKKIWSLEAEVFIPAAASRLISKEQVEEMIASKLEVIAAGANVPFADKEIFFGPIAEFTDSKVAVIPDFIANCGMARVFAYLMTADAEITDEAIFEDTSRTIEKALRKTFEASNSSVNISKTSFEIALSQLI
ncbi:Glu/Leu/Phe/Val dehydrogenase dimerization domain-containing protein [Marivirga arenosa]|uniref:Glu/Leu/Phe/Val dehydrogenase dimerization domain-containing protein n=1 Tax=Marivirga arenosa TaxID=3059076 RepID=A0AA51NAQ8_9BACT|nr:MULTISPECIES: Glu/Leu/Phe/Val dehydrogenase dimerization domain-containing protein [unclassified Marivirga]WMN07635.1 Glu/Leu/Phe/Val dehydrogenase dimerization domain-containing protein [Marivirga sp. ABR2-2]WNB18151.1 Glu/Leu/Phe/Val dehydrogenase dimerization domain-containing protein [Marivirga sp. BKB1-2]